MLQRCISLGAELSSLVTRSFLHLNLGVVFHKINRYDEAVSSYLRAYALFRRSGSEQQRAVTAMNLASLYETLGDRRRARELADEAIEITTRSASSYFRARALFVLGTIELSSERPDSAAAAFQEARDTLAATGGGPFEHRIVLGLARAAEQADSRPLRDELLGRVEPDTSNEEGQEIAAERDLTVGTLLLADGKAQQARDLLERVVSTFEALSLHERTWLARLFYGMALCGSGDLDKGTAILRSAAALIEFLARSVPQTLRDGYLSDPQRRMASDALAKAEAGIAPRLARQDRQAAEESIHSPAYAAWRARYESIVGEDERMRQIFHVVDRISESDSTVLIQGESGTGKELIAAAIHQHSPRRDSAFVKVNCAAFVETLLLSELFGHERGAFTGAISRKKGRFELADGGTLFLDEIGDISPNTQVSLLRVLQERRFERVGGSETVQVDVRLICATNRNLEEMVRSGTFRLDLYYRLKGVVIELPALRDRRADIPLLVDHFCRVHSPRPELAKSFSREAMAALVRYSWPGNIRELENLIQAIVLFVDGDIIEVSHVRQFDDFFADGAFLAQPPPFFRSWRTREARKAERRAEADAAPPARITLTDAVAAVATPSATAAGTVAQPPDDPEEWVARWALKSGIALPDLKSRIETESIKQALTQAEGNVTKAAGLLSMKRSRLSQIVNADDMLRELKSSFDDSSD
jgi:transcriptional regulator with GAF, ATPase, and Fis domain